MNHLLLYEKWFDEDIFVIPHIYKDKISIDWINKETKTKDAGRMTL